MSSEDLIDSEICTTSEEDSYTEEESLLPGEEFVCSVRHCSKYGIWGKSGARCGDCKALHCEGCKWNGSNEGDEWVCDLCYKSYFVPEENMPRDSYR